MPLYDYRCETCGIISDVAQSIHDDAYSNCPKCGKSGITRLIVAPQLNPEVSYYDEHLEAHITSWSQRSSLMKEKGLKEGRGDNDRRIVEQKKRQADQLRISVKELEHRFDRQRIKI